MDSILNRRSIRKYTNEPVSDTDINDLLEAAMCAPSGNNEKPWQFVVINERNILDEIPKFHPFSLALKKAQLGILVCGDLSLEKTKGLWVQGCSAAIENILIEAQYKGLGAVWLSFYPEEDRVIAMQKLLKMPEYIVPLSLIAIGHPDEKRPAPNRFDASRIHFNSF